ncbi:hypothetical protein AYO38_03490 [bacterium SCGC AG-212-C10]|nr:hypothetical protein AYO38_03490 [bacterium SCGC AG-212-C10]
MTDAQWDRAGALGGLMFVALLGAAGVLGGQPPAADASTTEIAEYLGGQEGPLRASVWLLGLGVMSLLWWAGSFWRRMVLRCHRGCLRSRGRRRRKLPTVL